LRRYIIAPSPPESSHALFFFQRRSIVVKIINVEKLSLLNRYSRSGKDFVVYDKKHKDVVIEVKIRPDYMVFAEMLIPNRQTEKATFLVEVKKKVAKTKKTKTTANVKTTRTK